MKLNSKLIKIIFLLITICLFFISFIFAWYVKNDNVSANGVNGSTLEYSEDGLISIDDSHSSKNYKIHQDLTISLVSTRAYSSVKVKFEYNNLSQNEYYSLCEQNKHLIRSDYSKNDIIYKPTTLDAQKEVMYNMYTNNNIIDFYTSVLTINSVEYTLAKRENTSTNIREYKLVNEDGTSESVSGDINTIFDISLKFGTSSYPSYTTDSTIIKALNYNSFLIGLNLKITFIAE